MDENKLKELQEKKIKTIGNLSFKVTNISDYNLFLKKAFSDSLKEDSKDWDKEKFSPLIKNIAYSFQYLEYIDLKILRSLESKEKLRSVIAKGYVKSGVIIGMSIVKAILYYFNKGREKKAFLFP